MTATATPAHARLAWSLFGGMSVLVGASVVIMLLHLDAARPVWGVRGAGAIWALTFGIVGLLLAVRVPRNPIGWLFLGAGALAAAMNLTGELALAPTASGRPEHPTWLGITTWLWIPVVAQFAVAIVLFPDGRIRSSRWRLFLWVFGAVTLAFTSMVALQQTPQETSSAWLASPVLGVTAGTWQLLSIVAVGSVIWRTRHAGQIERLQLRWVVSAATVLVAMIAGVELAGTASLLSEEVYLAASAGVSLVIPLLPVSIGIAVLRYRLYAIDRILSRTAVYGLVTATLVAIYLGAVLLLQVFFTTRSGQLPNIVVAITTLFVAAAFHPVRLRAQRLVNARFNRRLSDAVRVVEAFGHALRDEVDTDAVVRRLRQAADATVRPAGASVWMRSR